MGDLIEVIDAIFELVQGVARYTCVDGSLVVDGEWNREDIHVVEKQKESEHRVGRYVHFVKLERCEINVELTRDTADHGRFLGRLELLFAECPDLLGIVDDNDSVISLGVGISEEEITLFVF